MKARVSQLIACAPEAAFDAFVDPGKVSRFWLESASAPLSQGATVTWRFLTPGAVDSPVVESFLPARRLVLRWSDGSQVQFEFDEPSPGRTRVVAEYTIAADDALDEIVATTEGYAVVLCDLKTFLETGRSAGLVRAKAELVGTGQAATE